MPIAPSSDGSTVTRRKALSALAGAGGFAVAGCVGLGQDSDDGDGSLSGAIDISGSSTVYPLATAVGEEFMAEHGDVRVNISRTGSGGGFSNHFCVGNTDFNNASRPIQPAEEELCSENGTEWVELQVATDAVTVIVNNDADFVDCLTVEELSQIWSSGGAQRWSDVRSEFPDEPISRFGAAETSGTFDYFNEVIIGEDSHTDDYQATEDDNAILNGVRDNEYAIGYFGFAYYYSNPDRVKALGIDDGDGCVEPSLEAARTGEYTPLSRPLFTYAAISSLSKDQVAAFARFFLEQATNEQLVADRVGYVPLPEETQSTMQDRLESAIEDAQG
jgi:phosphate transport system substrate-binding protein